MSYFFDLQTLENLSYDTMHPITIGEETLLSALLFFKKNNFNLLLDIFGIDYPERKNRVQVNYILLNIYSNKRVCIRLSVGNKKTVTTCTQLFKAAPWFEREVYDMYGVVFENHINLRRILTDYNFEGFPMLKDFPLTGYKEVQYDFDSKEVIYKDVDLPQEYRDFNFLSPWEGMKLPEVNLNTSKKN